MLLTLYDQYGSVKATLSPNDTSTQDKEIQGDNVLSLSFTLYEYVSIDVNDYVDFEGERYWAVEKYLPNEKSTVEWEYNVKLYGIESLIKRFLVLKTVDGGNEAVFTLTARPIEHMRLIVQNINDGMDNTTNFKVGSVEGSDNVVIDYTGKYCDEGLKELAEKVGVEWWIEGETVNLCRCEHGEEVTLGYGNGLTSLDRDVSDNAKFYTRLFPIGSSRNIDPDRYGSSRLQLPGGVKYVDVNSERYGIIHHYEQEAFSGIYPRRVGVVSSVRSENVTDTDGNPFTSYYFKDNDIPFDPNDYEIGGLVKHVSFQEGSELAGLGVDNDHYFEVNYNSETREFEIITIWPYDDDTQLPGGTLVPKAGDRYILWNIRMPDEYYGLAESEFLGAVNEYNQKHALDVSCYKAPTDHVWIEDEGVDLYIGRRVRLESQEYFLDTGYRASRITRISRQVSLPSQMDLEISDALSTRTLDKIDDAITAVKNYTDTLVGSMNVPDIIKSGDTTRPTDNNLYSARRSHQEFLSKKKADVAEGLITFEEGIVSNGDVDINGYTTTSSLDVEEGMEVGGTAQFNGDVNIGAHSNLKIDGLTEVNGQTTVNNVVRMLADLLFGGYGSGGDELAHTGAKIDTSGDANLRQLVVRSLTKVTEGVFKQLTSANPSLQNRISGMFLDGFNGNGMQLWHDATKGWCMTLDTLTVRRTMYVYELVIQKIRAVGGILLVSAADGKIDSVKTVYDANDTEYYLITFEDINTFVRHDLMRCQSWKNGQHAQFAGELDQRVKYYWVEVGYSMTSDNIPTIYNQPTAVPTGRETVTLDEYSILVPIMVDGADQFAGVVPSSGDECVLMGNTDSVNHKDRQNYIMISASEDGRPRIDIMTGCDSTEDAGDVRTRLGCLDNGTYPGWGNRTPHPSGYGLYSDNAYLKGKFVISIGGNEHDVGTLFSVQEGRIQSMVEAVRQETIAEEGHITNNMFLDGLAHWYYVLDGDIYSVTDTNGNGVLLSNGVKPLVSTGMSDYSRLVSDDTVSFCDVLEIKGANSEPGIYQPHSDMHNIPSFDTDPDTGDIITRPFMVSFYYYAYENSIVTIHIGTRHLERSVLATTDGRYHKAIVTLQWDGTGDFMVTASGHVRVYGFVLSENIDVHTIDQYITQIEQTAQQISAKAEAQMDGVTVYLADFILAYNQWKTTVENNLTGLSSEIDQRADSITLGVTERIANKGNKYLTNPSFNGWTGWTRNGENASAGASLEIADGQSSVHIVNPTSGYVTLTQAHASFAELPVPYEHKVNGTNVNTFPVYAELWVKGDDGMRLILTLGANTKTVTLSGYSDYKRVTWPVEWNAQGDFSIAVAGVDTGHKNVHIHSLVLNANTDAVSESKIQIASDSILATVRDDITGATSGLALHSDLAELQTTVQGHAASIRTSVQYNRSTGEVTSNIKLSAEKIDLRGYTTVNDNFSIDKQGNASMNNATIAGVLNNLIQEKEFKDGNLQWDFNPLKWGSVIEWTPDPEHAHDTHNLYLPCAYTTDGTMIIDSSAGLTMRDMRQCVGKKYTFLCKTNDVSALMKVHGAVLLQREDYEDYIGETPLDLNSMALGTQVTPEHRYTRREWIGVANYGGITGNYYFTAECKMGKYSGYECIYWEVYCSALRGEVTYKVSGTAKVNNTPLKHMEVVFSRLVSASSEGQQYRTRTDNEGKFAIYLQGSELGVEYTMRVYLSDSASTPSTGTVTDEDGTAYGSNATFSNIIPVEQQDITANINITTS